MRAGLQGDACSVKETPALANRRGSPAPALGNDLRSQVLAPEPLCEPWPGLSGPQRVAMVALTAGPRLVAELADTCGWSPATTGSVLSALRRRGVAVEIAGLWSRA